MMLAGRKIQSFFANARMSTILSSHGFTTVRDFVKMPTRSCPVQWPKSRRIFLGGYEHDVNALRKLILQHDTLFTFARNYDVNADHNIERIHQHLVKQTKTVLPGMD